MKLTDVLGQGATINAKTINVINLPSGDDKEPVVNPGIEYGEDHKAKWSPPLQQDLDIKKDALGPTPDVDTTIEPVNAVTPDKKTEQLEFMKKLIALLNR
jgi:hypothetical protein